MVPQLINNKSGILATLQAHLYAGHITYILQTLWQELPFPISSLGIKEMLP